MVSSSNAQSVQVSPAGGSALTIGSIRLRDFEVPTSIRFGGHQKIAIHRTSDGKRSIELLGPDDGQIRFQGIFSGTDAESRARALDSVRLSGTAVWLTWQSYRYKVIVEEFTAVYHTQWWISFRVGCVVVHQPGVISTGMPSLQSALSTALSTAGEYLLGTAIDLSGLSSAVSDNTALTSGTSAHSAAVLAADQSLAAVQSEIGVQSADLAGSIQYSKTQDTASSFAQQVGYSGSLANAVNAKSYIGLVSASLVSLGG